MAGAKFAGSYKSETGNRYGRLLVLKDAGRDKHGRALWLCRCDCGKEKIAPGFKLRGVQVRSCGCYRSEKSRQTKLTDEERERRKTEPRECSGCNEIKAPEEFRYGNRKWCRACATRNQRLWRQRDNNGTRSNWRKKYGLTFEMYDEFFRQQKFDTLFT